MGQPVTTSPWLIMFINMTIVFAVLYGLSLVIRLIKVLDPTKPKTAPAADTAAAPAVVAAVEEAPAEDDAQLVAVLAAAIAAYGYSQDQIAFIRRVSGGEGWAQAGRLATVNSRSQMY